MGKALKNKTKLLNFVDVVADFGADPSGSTDSTLAIQAAINYLQLTTPPAVGPGSVNLYFPFGIYKITSALIVSKSLSFIGEGHSETSTGSRIVQYTSSTDHFTVQPISAGCSCSWTNLSMVSNGGGGTSGSSINITKNGTAGCNSVRIIGCTFGPPQTYAIKLQLCDDVIIRDCLFDNSATDCISLGTSAAGDIVSNCRIVGNTFFTIANYAIFANNVSGLIIANNCVYVQPGYNYLNVFFDGYVLTPYQVTGVVIQGNFFSKVNCIARLSNSVGVVINGNKGVNLGAGVGATSSLIEMYGTCSEISISGNDFSGSFGTKNFYSDAGGTVTGANFTGNILSNVLGTGQAWSVAGTTGTISNNTDLGFTTSSISEQVATTGNSIVPGAIASLGSYTKTISINGARQGDRITISPTQLSWPLPVGISVVAFISSANTISLLYNNSTASSITVAGHDLVILVTR